MLKSIITVISRKPATVSSVFDFEAALVALGGVVEQQTNAALQQQEAINTACIIRNGCEAEALKASRLITKLKSLLEL